MDGPNEREVSQYLERNNVPTGVLMSLYYLVGDGSMENEKPVADDSLGLSSVEKALLRSFNERLYIEYCTTIKYVELVQDPETSDYIVMVIDTDSRVYTCVKDVDDRCFGRMMTGKLYKFEELKV